ncbi:MAG: glucose 1-dehydrogenase [Candidatus Caldarchaeales archaeon]
MRVSVKRLFDLEGKKVVITGAAGGIGSAIAFGFAEFKAELALIDKEAEALRKIHSRLKEYSNSIIIQADVTSLNDVNQAIERIINHYGRIDILVNSHGIFQWVSAEEMNEEDWNRMLNVNLKGVFLMCQAVGRQMIKQRYGKIINIASMSGLIVNRPQPQLHYNTSKAGVIMLTKSLASEWAKYNINVNCVSPGYTLTQQLENFIKEKPEYADLWRGLIPLNRFAEVTDIVGAVIFLATDAASYITGQNLIIDGGYTIW